MSDIKVIKSGVLRGGTAWCGHIPAKGEDAQEVAVMFYVAATRAVQRQLLGISG